MPSLTHDTNQTSNWVLLLYEKILSYLISQPFRKTTTSYYADLYSVFFFFVAYPFRSIVYDNPTQIISYSHMHEQSLLQVRNGNIKQTFPLILVSHPKALPDVVFAHSLKVINLGSL